MLLKHTDNTWNDFTDNQGNKLHVGKLEFKTKHGKNPNCEVCTSNGCEVCPMPACTAFLEQPKVSDEDSDIHDSLMKQIKTSAINVEVHANSFGKVSGFISSLTSGNK